MSNGLPRTTKYKNLPLEEHLALIDNDLDNNDFQLELITKLAGKRLNYILITFVALLVTTIGTLLAIIVQGHS
jgi:hypothetical protein